MNKKFVAIAGLYFLQLLGSGCCSCPDTVIYERSYTNVDIIAYDTAGFQSTELKGDASAFRNAFGIGILVNSNLDAIGAAAEPRTNLNLGFTTALACSCPDDEYINKESIQDIQVRVLDVATEETTVVTQNFTREVYPSEERISLVEIVANLSPWEDGFRLDMSSLENIPDKAIFIVDVTLDNGVIFTNRTPVLTFL